MLNAELVVIMLNISIIFFSYLWLYPKVAGSDIYKVSTYDLVASVVAITISATLFWDSGIIFDAFFMTLNWFWFTLLTYFIIELPFIIWYFKKYDMFNSFDK